MRDCMKPLRIKMKKRDRYTVRPKVGCEGRGSTKMVWGFLVSLDPLRKFWASKFRKQT